MFRSWRALWLWCSGPEPERLAALNRPGLLVVDGPAAEAGSGPRPDVVLVHATSGLPASVSALARWRERGAADIPVLLVLDGALPVDMAAAMEAGFLLCVDGRAVSADALAAVLVCAAELAERSRNSRDERREMAGALGNLVEARFRLRTPEEARRMAGLLAEACPEPQRRVAGFVELLVNAIEHGNLGIGYEAKSRLLSEGAWPDEVERRLALPENQSKSVEILFSRREGAIEVTITDDGAGFRHSSFVSRSDDGSPELHGRGITVARQLSFDELTYLGRGNQVKVLVKTQAGTAPAGPR